MGFIRQLAKNRVNAINSCDFRSHHAKIIISNMAEEFPLVAVIIPNWNLKDDLVECLDSVLASDYGHLCITVVDNGSADDSVNWVRGHYPEVQVLTRTENGGYAAALNDGIREAASAAPGFILALNNDTIVPRGMITGLVEVLRQNPQAAIAAPKVLYQSQPDHIYSLGDRIYPWLPLPVRFGRKSLDRPAYNQIFEFDYVFGCALMIRSEVLQQVGLFDPSYFMFYEDADFCRRVRDAGWKILRAGSVTILHKGSLSVNKQADAMVYLRARNRSRFYRRYRHGPLPLLTFLALALGSAVTVFQFLFSNRAGQIGIYLKGALDGLKEKLPAPLNLSGQVKDG